MPSLHRALAPSAGKIAVIGLLLAFSMSCPPAAHAQAIVGGVNRAVGGVSISPDGLLSNPTVDDVGELRQVRSEVLAAMADDFNGPAEMRVISLRALDDAVRQAKEAGKHVPVEMQCLGGLLRIRYVLVLPEQNDILLVGPADGWKVDQHGAVVGTTTGRPIMLLDDLRVALRSANGPVRRVISCSIDPTPDGLQRVRTLASRLRPNSNPQATARGVERQLGPQQISVEGVPDTSHFARVMVAADYRMKRIGMGIERAPIRGLPAFTELMRATGRGMQNMLPRWWLAPEYEPLLRDADGLAWELRGSAVKAMSENDIIAADGSRRQTGRSDGASEKWAETMTQRYDELAMADPVFGQLQNCMDLAIVAALVAKENLARKARASLPMLLGEQGLETAQLPAPKQVESKAVISKGRNRMIACGGVQINPWAIVERAEVSDTLASVRGTTAANRQVDRWWD